LHDWVFLYFCKLYITGIPPSKHFPLNENSEHGLHQEGIYEIDIPVPTERVYRYIEIVMKEVRQNIIEIIVMKRSDLTIELVLKDVRLNHRDGTERRPTKPWY